MIKNSRRRIVLLDHDLKSRDNSATSHSLNFAEGLLAASIGAAVWAHQSCDLEDQKVSRVFRLSQGELNKFLVGGSRLISSKLRYLITIMRSNLSYFSDMLNRDTSSDHDILFAINAGPFNVFALLLYSSLHRRARIVIYFQRPVTRIVKSFGWIHRALRLSNVRYCTEVPKMAGQYNDTLSHPCSVLPCPNIFSYRAQAQTRSAESCIGLVLGEPRKQKGFDLLVESLRYLDGPLCSGKMRLVIQSTGVDKAGPELENSIKALNRQAKGVRGIDVVEGPIARDLYIELLEKCGFVILPYRFNSYHGQSSGIAFEALAYGRPIVVTRGLCFTDDMRTAGACVEAPDESPEGLAEAIEEMLRNHAKYVIGAEAISAKMRETHSWGNIARLVQSLFDQ